MRNLEFPPSGTSHESFFGERLREFFYYPKLNKETDSASATPTLLNFLSTSDRRDGFSLYTHIPFCNYLCHFCPFFKVLNSMISRDVRSRFFTAIENEIAKYGEAPYFSMRELEWIEFGGGTPTSMSLGEAKGIFTAIRNSFNLRRGAVITMEGDALTLSEEGKVEGLLDLGVNRFSFGVQTFDEPLRRKLGIKPTVQDLRKAANTLHAHGVEEFAIDLLYNLPDQTSESFQRDIDLALELEPAYIDFYPLTLWENTRFKDKVDSLRGFSQKPTTQANLELFEIARSRMLKLGWKAVRSYTFATPNPHPFIDVSQARLRAQGESIGIGPSSRGFIGGRHLINESSIDGYIQEIEAGRFPIDLGCECSEEEQVRRLMVLFPSMLLWVDTATIPNYSVLFEQQVNSLIKNGFIEQTGTIIKLTTAGQAWAGNVSREFFSADQKRAMTTSYLYARREGLNPYNQDHVGVSSRRKFKLP